MTDKWKKTNVGKKSNMNSQFVQFMRKLYKVAFSYQNYLEKKTSVLPNSITGFCDFCKLKIILTSYNEYYNFLGL